MSRTRSRLCLCLDECLFPLKVRNRCPLCLSDNEFYRGNFFSHLKSDEALREEWFSLNPQGDFNLPGHIFGIRRGHIKNQIMYIISYTSNWFRFNWKSSTIRMTSLQQNELNKSLYGATCWCRHETTCVDYVAFFKSVDFHFHLFIGTSKRK